MKTLKFGPVLHEGKSWAYSLGWAAYMMGNPNCPYDYDTKRQQNEDFCDGYQACEENCSKVIDKFIEDNAL